MNKISIRFFGDYPVRAVWNEEKSTWYFSVLDVVSAIREEQDYSKAKNYWKYLKAKLKKEGSQLVSGTTQLKLEAKDGKKYLSDALSFDGINLLLAEFPGKVGTKFASWFVRSEDTIDAKSKQKAYELFDSALFNSIEVGTTKGLRQIHSYLFGGLYSFAGQIRTQNIAKGGFAFAKAQFLDETLKSVEEMPDSTFDEIIEKYVEMNIAHPFAEGNGRATRIWLDLMLKKSLGKCTDWSKIDKKEYLDAMKESITDSSHIHKLISGALTAEIQNRQVYMKGIDYSYYYEEVDD